jgi:NitT/TauT family transport system substrate-binding protein
LKWFDGYLESISTLTAGQIDANSQTLGDTVSSVAGGAEQVVVLVNDNSTGNGKVIVRDGIGAIADLKGKKVAAEEGTVDHFLLLSRRAQLFVKRCRRFTKRKTLDQHGLCCTNPSYI